MQGFLTKYTVNFETNADFVIESQIVLKGEKVYEPRIEEREYYKFLGWYVGEEKSSFKNHPSNV